MAVERIEDLARSARGGDAAAFERLVRRFRGAILSYLAVRLHDAASAEDLLQETLLTAFRRMGTFDPAQPFFPWLRGIAQNLLRNERRKKRPQLIDDRIEAAALRQTDAMGEADLVGALQHCLESLDGRSARIVTAHYRDRRSFDEIAGTEASTPKAVSMALVRIRRKLKDCIQKRVGSHKHEHGTAV